MANTTWFRQGSEPLFPALDWNKPERRDQAGSVLVAGGTIHSLTAIATCYELLRHQGIGTILLALPDKTKRLVGSTLPEAVFLPSTATGELAQEGIETLLDYASSVDTMLLPGDAGRNSQTTILFEECLKSYAKQIVITRDALDSFVHQPVLLIDRPHTTLVVSFAQLQKLTIHSKQPQALTFTMDLLKLIEFLQNYTKSHAANLVTQHQNQILVAVDGKVSTTKLPSATDSKTPPWRIRYSSFATSYLTWNLHTPFEALAQSAYQLVGML